MALMIRTRLNTGRPPGNRKEVTLKRSKRFAALLKAQPAGESVKLLRGGVGYADLTRLKRQQVDSTV